MLMQEKFLNSVDSYREKMKKPSVMKAIFSVQVLEVVLGYFLDFIGLDFFNIIKVAWVITLKNS